MELGCQQVWDQVWPRRSLAFFIALYIRLNNPTWAFITTFVLMVAQYVGPSQRRRCFRFIGTVVGGVLGYVLTGSLEQNPVIYLLLLGSSLAPARP